MAAAVLICRLARLVVGLGVLVVGVLGTPYPLQRPVVRELVVKVFLVVLVEAQVVTARAAAAGLVPQARLEQLRWLEAAARERHRQ